VTIVPSRESRRRTRARKSCILVTRGSSLAAPFCRDSQSAVQSRAPGVLARLANPPIGGADLPRALLRDLAHALRQAPRGELVGVVLAHQAAIGLGDLR